jgi:rhodanese-related sulfurtransferase
MAEGSDDTKVSAKQARELVAGGDATVIDISTDEEWSRIGNIAGALRVSEDDVESRLDEVREDTRVLVVCGDGERSAKVAEQLRERDLDAISIDGGMLAWEDERLPLQPSEDPALPSDPGSVEDEISTTDSTDSSDQPATAEEAATADQPPSSEETPRPRESG